MADNIDSKAEALLVAARCPKCGGALGPAETGTYACEYCGTSFVARELVAAKSIDLREFYEQALAAVEEGDYGRANEYFKRVLETDAAEYQAWVGKGIAGAYAGLNDNQSLEPGEVLSCVDMALAYYDGDDKAAFETTLADRVGALAVDLFGRVMEEQVNDEKNLRGVLDLLSYWEEKGTEELESWIAIVAAAEKPAIPPKAKRDPGATYLTFNYPFKKVAQKYAQKIRAEYDPEFTNVFERGAEAQKEITKSLRKIGTVALFVIVGIIGLAIIVLLFLFALGFAGFAYFA